MRPLIIGPEQLDAVQKAIEEARKSPVQFGRADVFEEQGKGRFSLADRPQGFERTQASQHVELPIGYTCALSFEAQPAGLCRHLSVSVAEKGRVPAPQAMAMIAKAFGFRSFPPDPGHVWLEEWRPGHEAVNIVQLEPT